MNEVFCENCAREIKKSARDQKFCSAECRIAFRRQESAKETEPRLRPRRIVD